MKKVCSFFKKETPFGDGESLFFDRESPFSVKQVVLLGSAQTFFLGSASSTIGSAMKTTVQLVTC